MMNSGGGRKIPAIPFRQAKDRDEDLLLFRDLHKREKDRIASLLQPVSDEFEPNAGNYSLYRMKSGKKGPGYDFLAENDKNDYDWLKTPPATPLFPSLEMEANAQELVIVQREIPIIQPLSRFAGNSGAPKGISGRPKSPKPKPKVPVRSITPSQRPSIFPTENKNAKGTTVLNQKTTILTTDPNSKKTHIDFIISNLSRNLGTDTKTKPKSRGVSPSVRSTIPAQIPGFSNEPPPNLRTDRPASATRGRPNPTLSLHQKSEPVARPRRQSCSPSVTRGRKVEPKLNESEGNLTTQKGRNVQTGTQILGSRMVDKVMNARKSGAEERETKTKSRGSISEVTAYPFGKTMPRSSLDMALKHMEIKRDRSNSRQIGVFPGKTISRE